MEDLIINFDDMPKHCKEYLMSFDDWKSNFENKGLYEYKSLLKPKDGMTYKDTITIMSLSALTLIIIEDWLFNCHKDKLNCTKIMIEMG